MMMRRMLIWSLCLFSITTLCMAESPPTAPLNVHSTSHQIGIASTNAFIEMKWAAATDPDGNLEGYFYQWDHVSTTSIQLSNQLTQFDLSVQSEPLEDASDWYFHIKSFDEYVNMSQTIHLGPFIIITQPEIVSISPSSINNDASAELTVKGAFFIDGATVKIGNRLSDDVDFIDESTLIVTIPKGYFPGSYDISVSNPNGKTDTETQVLTIVPVVGDVNGDKAIDLTDMIRVLQVIAGIQPDVLLSADINGDLRIGLEEGVYLLQMIAGMEL